MAIKKHSSTERRQSKRKATGEDWEKVFHKLMKQKKPYLTAATVHKINEMAPLDPTRRLALAMLGRPFSLLVKNARKSREFAVGIAGIEDCLASHVKGYRQLADLLETASLRMTMAICIRPDSDAVLKEGKKAVVSHDDGGARQIATQALQPKAVHHA